MPRTVHVTAHVDPAIKAALQQLADEDGRPLSTYVERLLHRHLDQKKRLPTGASKIVKPRPGAAGKAG